MMIEEIQKEIQKELEKVTKTIEEMEQLQRSDLSPLLSKEHYLRYTTLLLVKSNLLLALTMYPKLIPYDGSEKGESL